MEAKEFMVGDWVRIVLPNVIHCRINNIEQLCYLEEEDIDIQPIPITPEILEANWFKKIPNYDVWVYKQKGIEVRVPLDSFRTFICCKYHTVRCKIAYVHELQHALRLCKINKEIEL